MNSAAFVPHICGVKQWPFSSSGIWSLTLSSVSKQLLTGTHFFGEPICSTVLYPYLLSLRGSHGEDLIRSLLLRFLPQHLMFVPGAFPCGNAGTILPCVTYELFAPSLMDIVLYWIELFKCNRHCWSAGSARPSRVASHFCVREWEGE